MGGIPMQKSSAALHVFGSKCSKRWPNLDLGTESHVQICDSVTRCWSFGYHSGVSFLGTKTLWRNALRMPDRSVMHDTHVRDVCHLTRCE
jgi:hypothetical protein